MSTPLKLFIHCGLVVLALTLGFGLLSPLYARSTAIQTVQENIAKHRKALAKLENPQRGGSGLSLDLLVSGDLGEQRLNIQQSLSGILRSTEARMDRMRQLPDTNNESGDGVELRVQVQWSGDLLTMVETIRAIDGLRPMIFLEELTFNAGPPDREDRLLRADATFVRLWMPQDQVE